MEVDEAGEQRKKRPRTSAPSSAASPASAAGNGDIDAASALDDDDSSAGASSSASVASSPDPQPQPESSTFRVRPSPDLDLLNEIQSANILLLIYLSRLQPETRAGTKAAEMLLGQVKPIAELRDTFHDAASGGTLVRDGYAAFLEVKDLDHTNYDFVPLLKHLPGCVGDLLVKHVNLTIELKSSLYAVAADPSNWMETPEISSGSDDEATTPVGSTTPDSSSSTMCSGIYDDMM